MEVRFVPLALDRLDGLRFEAIALPCFEDERPLRGAAGLCDWRLCGRISRWLQSGVVRGTRGEVTLLPPRGRLPFEKLLLFGLGPRAEFDAKVFADVSTLMLRTLEALRLRAAVMSLPGRGSGVVQPAEAIRWFLDAAGENAPFDEIVLIDENDAQRAMVPVVDAEKRRQRAARQLAEG